MLRIATARFLPNLPEALELVRVLPPKATGLNACLDARPHTPSQYPGSPKAGAVSGAGVRTPTVLGVAVQGDSGRFAANPHQPPLPAPSPPEKQVAIASSP